MNQLIRSLRSKVTPEAILLDFHYQINWDVAWNFSDWWKKTRKSSFIQTKQRRICLHCEHTGRVQGQRERGLLSGSGSREFWETWLTVNHLFTAEPMEASFHSGGVSRWLTGEFRGGEGCLFVFVFWSICCRRPLPGNMPRHALHTSSCWTAAVIPALLFLQSKLLKPGACFQALPLLSAFNQGGREGGKGRGGK